MQSVSVKSAPDSSRDGAWDAKDGETLARQVCSSCHVFPEPGILDRTTWGLEVLPDMGRRMGIDEVPYSDRPLDPRVRAAGLIPAEPLVPIQAWRTICSWYLAQSPNALEVPEEGEWSDDRLFRPDPFPLALDPTLTMVRWNPADRRFYLGIGHSNALVVAESHGAIHASYPLSSPPVSAVFPPGNPGEAWLTLVGSYVPSDAVSGGLLQLRGGVSGVADPWLMVDGLPRPVDLVAVDLDQDGLQDWVVCGYGNMLGEVTWHRGLGGGRFETRTLLEVAGAIRVEVADVDGSAHPDLWILTAQAKEGLTLLLNPGTPKGEIHSALQFHPSWGTSDMEWGDFNQDGQQDLLICNGDNGDLSLLNPPVKPYHGIRFYEATGEGRLEERAFVALPGAFRAVTGDWDEDGDLDVAVVAFYPDAEGHPERSAVWLENLGGFQFRRQVLAEASQGRWITLESGDFDGDGDLDLALGSYVYGPNQMPDNLMSRWKRINRPLVLYRNNRR